MSSEIKHLYDFGPFRLDSAERVLLRRGALVPLSPKVFEILLVLVRNHGHIVEKGQLLDEVWPDAFVEEGNINVHISALRKVLGEAADGQRYIQTIPRRGYRFVAAVDVVGDTPVDLGVQKRSLTGFVQQEENRAEVPSSPLPALTPTKAVVAAQEAPGRRWRRSPAVGVGLAVMLGLSGLAGFFLAHARSPLDHVSFSGDKLLAWDERGKLAWEYRFAQPLFRSYPTETSRLIRIVDLNGDGRKELLAAVPFAQESYAVPRSVVYCFSTNGKVLWTYDPQVKLEFKQKEYEGPWHARDMLISPGPGPKSTWVAFSDLTWWPAFVVKLDAQGGGALQFVNSGHLTQLDYVENKTGRYVLAAGMNNELQSAILAVIAEDQPLSVSPQIYGSIYESRLLRAGVAAFPYRYFEFMPSELFRLREARFHNVLQLSVWKNAVEVRTFEGQDPRSPSPYLAGLYELTPDFEIQSASFDDDYWMLHRQLEHEGRIGHSGQQCPDRLNRVRVWSAEKTWSEAPLVSLKSKN